VFSKKAKELADLEIQLYKREQQFAIAQEVHEKRVGNWQTINQIREDRRKVEVDEARKMGIMEGAKNSFEIISASKDRQIEMLTDLLGKAISALNNRAVNAQ
jgi:hypothetical protein